MYYWVQCSYQNLFNCRRMKHWEARVSTKCPFIQFFIKCKSYLQAKISELDSYQCHTFHQQNSLWSTKLFKILKLRICLLMGNLHLHFSVQMKCVTGLFCEGSWRVYLFLVMDTYYKTGSEMIQICTADVFWEWETSGNERTYFILRGELIKFSGLQLL